MTSIEAFRARDHSRRIGDPAIRCCVSPFRKQMQRMIHGTPDDHPAVHQFVAEVRYLDEVQEDRRTAMRTRTTGGTRGGGDAA